MLQKWSACRIFKNQGANYTSDTSSTQEPFFVVPLFLESAREKWPTNIKLWQQLVSSLNSHVSED